MDKERDDIIDCRIYDGKPREDVIFWKEIDEDGNITKICIGSYIEIKRPEFTPIELYD